MKNYSINNLRSGIKIIFNNLPYLVESVEFVKPGKGQAFNRIKMRCLVNDNLIEKIFKPTSILKEANILETNLFYLYFDKEYYYFMHPKNFFHYQVEKKIIHSVSKWLFTNIYYVAIIWNNNIIKVIPPNFVEVKVLETSPSIKGESIGKNNKIAIISNNTKIRVPIFIKKNEIIKIDTRSGEYISRIK